MEFPKTTDELIREFGDPRESFSEWKTDPEGCSYAKENIVRVALYGIDKSFPCHSKLADKFYKVNKEAFELGQLRTCDGIYVPRLKVWARRKYGKVEDPYSIPLKAISLHSWGICEDCNASTNGYGTSGDMPSEMVKIFTDEGFFWGGKFSLLDPMHFQFAAGNL